MTEIETYVEGAFNSDVDLQIESLQNLGKILTESISSLTKTEIHIFRYHIVPSNRCAVCNFYAEGEFPIAVYEGVCSFRLENDAKVTSSCDMFPFWKDLRLTFDTTGAAPTTYINVNLKVDISSGTITHEYFWTEDCYGEWEYLDKPSREDYSEVKVTIDCI